MSIIWQIDGDEIKFNEGFEKGKFNICFLDETSDDFIWHIAPEQNAFHLSDIVKILSPYSGKYLTTPGLARVSHVLDSRLTELFKKIPHLKIRDDEIHVVFYTMTEYSPTSLPIEDPPIQLLYVWSFSAKNVKKTKQAREYWMSKNDLPYRNCCKRNQLIALSEKFPGKNDVISFYDIPELNDFCLFPEQFVDVDVLYYAHLVNPIRAEEVSLDLRLNNLTRNDEFCLISNEIPFYSTNSLEKYAKIKNEILQTELEILENEAISNLNCQDLLSNLEGSNLATFLYNCLLTCYLTQMELTPENEEYVNQNVKILKCYFSF